MTILVEVFLGLALWLVLAALRRLPRRVRPFGRVRGPVAARCRCWPWPWA